MGDNYDKSDSMWEKTEEEERNINEKGDIHSFVCVQMCKQDLLVTVETPLKPALASSDPPHPAHKRTWTLT